MLNKLHICIIIYSIYWQYSLYEKSYMPSNMYINVHICILPFLYNV